MAAIRVAIIAKHPLVRRGMRDLINDQPNMRTVSVGETVEDAILIAELEYPDVVIIDGGTLRGKVAAAYVKYVKSRLPGIRVYFLGTQSDKSCLAALESAQIDGYSDFLAPFSDLLQLIRARVDASSPLENFSDRPMDLLHDVV
ncbi:response regulator transcription factor [Sulfoacidibacillus thermotolerans]|uniref:Response regulatory domain-containing protein n=1 Tax=Sulfoacidibacillus thermotolerans TaxID=1765684 RepID=A0A2U3D6J1_SULT2|nr:response regulator transcription factor [Sulfoacidibacillus thermotolerans]PWI56897.1 hypothetical protein BM613_11275 [Sulfoacidibacillus thermotolerans]